LPLVVDDGVRWERASKLPHNAAACIVRLKANLACILAFAPRAQRLADEKVGTKRLTGWVYDTKELLDQLDDAFIQAGAPSRHDNARKRSA
jgi:hypothetical protein